MTSDQDRSPIDSPGERGSETVTAAHVPPLGPLTLDDVTRLSANDDGHRYELSEGNLIVMPPGPWRHQEISLLMAAWLLAGGYRGRVNVAPGVQTATDSLDGRIPDLVVTTKPAADEVVWLRPENVALAVEIVSKGSERTDRWMKPPEYAAVSIPRFWRVEPDETVLRFELRGDAYAEADRIPLADLLAGEVPDLS
jgi:Uma2 family endonuclease